MKGFLKRHRTGALLVPVLLWCLWYSRPVDIHTLLKNTPPDCISGIVFSKVGSTWFPSQSRAFSVEGQYAGLLMEHLESLRFHRSPLEPLLRLLPATDSGPKMLDGQPDNYHIYLTFYTRESPEDWTMLQEMRFFIDEWSYGPYAKLPLYFSHREETGRELGAFLWEFAEEMKSIS